MELFVVRTQVAWCGRRHPVMRVVTLRALVEALVNVARFPGSLGVT
jgi:hypothetical protein